MEITKNKVAAFHYQLFESDAKLEDSWEDNQQVLYLHGRGGMLPGIEQALEGKVEGDRFEITLDPENGYGQRQENAVQRVPIKHVAKGAKPRVGAVVQLNTESGPREVVVTKVGRFNLDVDTNHPLAGKTLRFSIEVGAVRDASTEELAHGHAHGAGGHQH